MYSSKLRSGEAEIIDSNTVISFNPAPYGKNPLKNKTKEPRPIEIDCFFKKEFLFRLRFEFIDSNDDNGKPSWRSEPAGNKTQKFVIKNLYNSAGPIGSFLAFDVASSSDGSVFYVSFSVTELQLNVKLDYTIYRIKEGATNENKS